MSQILENANPRESLRIYANLVFPQAFCGDSCKPQFGERFAPIRVPGTNTGFRFGKKVILLRTHNLTAVRRPDRGDIQRFYPMNRYFARAVEIQIVAVRNELFSR
ncbi:MAG: hypothetical protein IT331_16435 [Anaerolineae bacterium]|nr:hypothetical protein [Anaerolineae bacterium]